MENTDKSIVVYKSSDGLVSFDVSVDVAQDTVWLTQEQLVSLFERDQSVISRHIKNVFQENEQDEKRNMQKMHIANSDKPVVFYSLDVIISVGYRVKSKRGIEFRQWATKVLKDYLLNGYAANNRKLKEIEAAITTLIRDGQLQKDVTQKLVADMEFIKRMLTPPNLVVQNYFEVHVNTEVEASKTELTQQLAAIKDLISGTSLKRLIEEQIANLKHVEHKEAQTGLTKFVQTLGKTNSQIARSLTDAGVSLTVLKKIVKLGLAVLSQLKPS